MRLEIYQDKPKEEEEKILTLRLLPAVSVDGGITLAVVDKNGKRIMGGSILAIKSDGTLKRFTGVASCLQRETNSGGKIREESS